MRNVSHIRFSEELQKVAMLIGEIQHDGPLAWSDEEVNAHKIMKYPPGRWILHTFPLLIGKGRVMLLKRLRSGTPGPHTPTNTRS